MIKFWFHHLRIAWLWGNHSTSLCLSLLTCKLGVLVLPQGVVRMEENACTTVLRGMLGTWSQELLALII